MQNNDKQIISELQNTIANCQKVNAQQNENFINFTKVMMKTMIEKDKEIFSQNQKFKAFEKEVMQKLSNQKINIDRLELKSQEMTSLQSSPISTNTLVHTTTTIEITTAPCCTRCKKNIVSEKSKTSKMWKSRCTLCLSKGRTHEINRKRRRKQ
jgi:hypothetical protein